MYFWIMPKIFLCFFLGILYKYTCIAHTTKSSSPTSLTLASTTSSAPDAPDHVTPNDTIGNFTNTVCFSCEDLSHVELCDVVQICNVDETCYVESYFKYGRKLYRSGCLQSTVCLREMNSTQHMPERCTECCSQNYCNNEGCGDRGLVSRDQRGPMCYDCPHEWSPHNCSKVTLCAKDEFCSIEELKWGDHSHFKMGCGQCIPTTHSTRAMSVCRSCCTDDFCNLNCTTSNAGSVIVG